MEETKMKYYAFISYKREDEKWAKWLQHSLENYKLPASIRAQDVSIPKYIRPIFRDNTDLSGTVLQDSLDDGLLHSKFLIVICSPNVIESAWVTREIQNFLDTGRENRIIPFIIDGVPMSSDPKKECLPKILRELPRGHELLGISLPELGKEKALIRTVSTLMGVQFDSIWNRHRRSVMRQRIRLGILAFLVLLAALFAWDYNRPTYQYFSDYVDCYGVPEGIIPLTQDQVSHRANSYRFEYRRIPFGQPNAYQWRVAQVDYVNSHGSVTPFEDPEVHFRTPSVRVEYYENGTISRLVNCDAQGRILFRQSLSERHGVTAAVVDFLCAQEQFGVGFTIKEVASDQLDEDGIDIMDYLTQSKSTIVRLVYQRDEKGHITQTTFHSNNDSDLSRSATCDANGIFGLQYQLDTLGRPVRITFIDNDQQITNDRSGVAYRTISYDKMGKFKEIANYDRNGNSIFNSVRWAKRVSQMDEYGNEILTSYYGIHGEPFLNTSKLASYKTEYNDRGDVLRIRLMGTDGKPCIGSQRYCSYTYEYDRHGNAIAINYFDTKGKPCIAEVGYARKTIEYDSKGNKTEECYYDTHGNRYASTEGVSRWVMKYDKHNNLIEERYFDIHDQPCVWTEGYHHCYTVFNDRDLPVEESYFDVNDKPCCNTDGIARIVAEYDDRGNLVKHTYYDEKGELTKTLDGGYAIWVGEYNDRGQRTRIEMRDEKNNLCLCVEGYAVLENSYDEQGRVTQISYFGTDERPIICSNGYASHRFGFDERGNNVSEYYFDTNGNPIGSYDGAAGWTATYDNNSNVLLLTFLNKEGKPCNLLSSGYASKENIYDNLYNLAGNRYYNAQGKLCKYNGEYAISAAKYDERGNKISTSYFDENEVPCTTKDGYAKWTAKYNERNYIIATNYYDVNGKPTLCKEGYASNRIEHDDFGNWTDISYFGTDGKPCLAYGTFSRWSGVYNALGVLEKEVYYDLNGKVISGK